MDTTLQTQDPDALYSGKRPRYPLNRWVGWIQNQSGRVEESENHEPLHGVETRSLGYTASNTIAIQISIFITYWYRVIPSLEAPNYCL
jgi:hypothetical protein